MCNWVCPECGQCDHSGCDVGMVTDMYFEAHYVNGVNVNPDRNTKTSTVLCHSCGARFTVSWTGGDPPRSQRIVAGACGE